MSSDTTVPFGMPFETSQAEKLEADATYRKITRKLLPLLFVSYLLAYLDRINIGYAQLQMKQELGFSDAVYGLGAGLFFITYLLLEVPSNILLERVGARLTFLRIMVLWGFASAATMFVSAPWQFYVIRLLLGALEAGFFPGVILYLSYWFPSARRGRATGQFMFALPFAGVVGGPLSGWIMSSLNGAHGWSGWQWCFLLEGLPTVLMGLVCYLRLDDGPRAAGWLSEREKTLVIADLEVDHAQGGAHAGHRGRFREAFADPRIYLLGFVYFGLACGGYTFSFWLPTMIRRLGVVDVGQIGLLSLFPYAFAAAGMLLIPRSSDLRRERRWHLAVALVLGAVALSASTLAGGSLVASLGILCVAGFFVIGPGSLFWTLPPTYLRPEAAGIGIAVVSSIGILGGFVSPTLIGFISSETGSLSAGLYVVSAVLVMGAVAVLVGMPARALRVGPRTIR